MITLLVLTPVFKYMPSNAQGAIIIAAVIGLFRYDEWFFLWKVGARLITRFSPLESMLLNIRQLRFSLERLKSLERLQAWLH